MGKGIPLWMKLLAVVGVLFLVYYLRNVLLPFAVAFMLAYLLNPVVVWVNGLVRKRWLSVAITLLGTVAIVGGVMAWVLPLIFNETRHLYSLLAERDLLTQWRNVLPGFLVHHIEGIASDEGLASIFVSDNIGALIEKVVPRLTQFFSQTFNLVASVLGGAIVILYLIFIMLDYDEVSSGIEEMIPLRYKARFMKFFDRFTGEMQKYFRGQIMIVICVMVLYAFGFWLVGLPLGVMLGLMIGLLNIVPYLQIAGFVPALLLCIVKTVEDGTPLWAVIMMVAAVFIVVQILQDMIITPKIMGKTTGLNPAMILLSLSIWGKLLGFLGLIVAIPFSCLVKLYYLEYKEKIENKHINEETDSDRRSDSIGQD